MKYTVEVAGRSLQVEIEGDSVLVDGRPVEARLMGERGAAIRRLVRGRNLRTLHASPGEAKGQWQVAIAGCRLDVQVLAPRDLAARGAGGRKGTAGGGTLKAPMPGMVVRILVAEGDTVEAGQGLVVLEAMKMENQLKAAGPGVVTTIHVAPGARVEKGAALLVVQ
jgi:biotin carboxyl carrier protein